MKIMYKNIYCKSAVRKGYISFHYYRHQSGNTHFSHVETRVRKMTKINFYKYADKMKKKYTLCGSTLHF